MLSTCRNQQISACGRSHERIVSNRDLEQTLTPLWFPLYQKKKKKLLHSAVWHYKLTAKEAESSDSQLSASGASL